MSMLRSPKNKKDQKNIRQYEVKSNVKPNQKLYFRKQPTIKKEQQKHFIYNFKKNLSSTMDFNQTNSSLLDKSNTRDVNQLVNCKSNPTLLKFNNYIKIQNCEPKKIEKYLNEFRSQAQKHQNKAYDQSIKINNLTRSKVKSNEGSPKYYKQQRFIRSSLGSQTDMCGKVIEKEQQKMNYEKKLLKISKQKQRSQIDLKKRIQYLQNSNIKAQERYQKYRKQYLVTKKELTEKNKIIEKLTRQINELCQENTILKKQIQEINDDNSILKGLTFNPSQFCDNNNNNDTSLIAFDMTDTAQYIANVSDLQEELNRKNSQIFRLNKQIQELKVIQHCEQLKHQHSLQDIELAWKNKCMQLFEKYSKLKDQFIDLKKNCTKPRLLKRPQKYEIEIQKSEIFNLSMSIQ